MTSSIGSRLALAFLEGLVRAGGDRALDRFEEWIDERRRQRPRELDEHCPQCGRAKTCPMGCPVAGPRSVDWRTTPATALLREWFEAANADHRGSDLWERTRLFLDPPKGGD